MTFKLKLFGQDNVNLKGGCFIAGNIALTNGVKTSFFLNIEKKGRYLQS